MPVSVEIQQFERIIAQVLQRQRQTMRKFTPVHPGVVLDEFMKPMGLSQYRLAKRINVPPRRINEIVLEKRAITPDTALRLGRFFGMSAEFWLDLQARYDLECEKARIGKRLLRDIKPYV